MRLVHKDTIKDLLTRSTSNTGTACPQGSCGARHGGGRGTEPRAARQRWRQGMAAWWCRLRRREWRAWSWCCRRTPTTRATPLVGRSWPGWRTWPPSRPGACREGGIGAGGLGHSCVVGAFWRWWGDRDRRAAFGDGTGGWQSNAHGGAWEGQAHIPQGSPGSGCDGDTAWGDTCPAAGCAMPTPRCVPSRCSTSAGRRRSGTAWCSKPSSTTPSRTGECWWQLLQPFSRLPVPHPFFFPPAWRWGSAPRPMTRRCLSAGGTSTAPS